MWEALAAHCGELAATHGSVLAALAFAGLAGGATHCAGMCGPFVLAQVGTRGCAGGAAGLSEWRRLRGAALLPYHLGRATTYAGLASVAAAMTGGLKALSGLYLLAPALLLVTAFVFTAMALGNVAPRLAGAVAIGQLGGAVARITAPLFAAPTGWRGYGLGVALGFLPCGLIYGAVAAAASTGSPLVASIGMAGFTLGTMPSLVAVGWLGELATRRYRALARYVMPPLMLVNALVLAWLAWRLFQSA